VDVVARAIQEPLGKVLGQPVVIDYKVGAAGNIASEYVARAKPDGYTLVFGTAATHGSNAALYKKLSFDVENDFVPVAPILDVSNVLTINPDVMNVKTLQEFVDLVKANPGKYNYASTGNGTGTHMAFAEFNSRLGLNMTHCAVQGRAGGDAGGAQGRDLLHHEPGADGDDAVQGRQGAAARRDHGQARRRDPDVPTIAESKLPGTAGFDSSIWFAVFAPKGTDPRVVAKLNGAIKTVLENPEVRTKLEQAGNVRADRDARASSRPRCTRIA
jgi:tripartite-type tricarboxylate transporter receptor subunit TctC